MTNKDANKSDQLKRYFARRVINQVRLILSIWRLLNEEAWTKARLEDLTHSTKTLIRFAKHFNEETHHRIALDIFQHLEAIDISSGAPSSEHLEKLSELIQLLSRTALRKSDIDSSAFSPMLGPKKPIYIALQDKTEALKLAEQLDFFGFRMKVFEDPDSFLEDMSRRRPASVIMDVSFGTEAMCGSQLLSKCQEAYESPIEAIFFSKEEDDIFTRLEASRSGGTYFHHKKLEVSLVVEQLESITHITPPTPYKVLIIDDSKSQSMASQKILNNAGMITEITNDPLMVLEVLEKDTPEIILMDMYMPNCSGTELAKVIRQQQKYLHIPIIFLSAEEDLDKQMSAMTKGGDEFLTKPMEPRHLIASVRAKGERARALVSLMIRDSLTGLLNHTRILYELNLEIQKAKERGTPICFAMVDIDHFKSINDTYGHPVGDRVIKQLSMFLKQRLRKSDAIGRYGGEEFAVVLPDTELHDAVEFFDQIREQFHQFKHRSEQKEFNVSFSCGVAQLDDTNEEVLTVKADEALYEAKRGGRNQVCYSKPAQSNK